MEKFDTSVSGQSTSSKDQSEGPQRLIWDIEKKKWEWKCMREEDMYLSPTDGMPKKNGWCWEGIHCTNPNCRFKHRNLPPIEDGSSPTRTLPSSIRGPRQHRNTSSARVYDEDYFEDEVGPRLKTVPTKLGDGQLIDVPPGMHRERSAMNALQNHVMNSPSPKEQMAVNVARHYVNQL